MQTPQQQIIAELKTELAMRRKVWRKIAGSQDQFIETEHQRRYNLMVLMLELAEVQTDRELNTLIDRVRRNKEAATAQNSLFSMEALNDALFSEYMRPADTRP